MPKKKKATKKEAALIGGNATMAKYGTKHYSRMTLARWHPEEYAKLAPLKPKRTK